MEHTDAGAATSPGGARVMRRELTDTQVIEQAQAAQAHVKRGGSLSRWLDSKGFTGADRTAIVVAVSELDDVDEVRDDVRAIEVIARKLEDDMARRGGPRIPKVKKPKRHEKRVAYKLIPKDSAAGKPMYAMLDRLIEQHHTELTHARIALAWNLSWKPDADGIKKLGKCKKASDLDRELASWDFVIVLSQEFWSDAQVNDSQRKALLDHELEHATVRFDREGEPLRDERGRVVYRMRKHDIEEFRSVIARNGMYKRDLQDFAEIVLRKQKSLIDHDKKLVPTPVPPTAAAAAEKQASAR
jgi:putative metallopeptidase